MKEVNALTTLFCFFLILMLSVCTQCESALDAQRNHEKRKAQENNEKHFCKKI